MNLNSYKDEVDTWLKEYFKDKGTYNKSVYEAMSYSVNIGGKRIRPILALITYKIYNKNYKEALSIACAIEMIHTYSLIHDDLPCMDDDDLRRGKPTNHKVFGDGLAVLAGDGLLNEAFNIILKNGCQKGMTWVEAGYEIGKASGVEGMIGGQVVDVLNTNKSIEIEELDYIHEKKTAALITASIMAGAILGEANEKDTTILKEFGKKLGLAFQIKDDILDIESDTRKLGKTIGKDKEQNKNTFVKFYGLEKCKKMCKDLTSSCIELLQNMNKDTKELEEITLYLLNRDF